MSSISSKQVGDVDSVSDRSNSDLNFTNSFDSNLGMQAFIQQNLGGTTTAKEPRKGSRIRGNRRQMQNKLGEEDAVSEKPEDLETSSGGSNSGSSCQDLSEDEHNDVLSSVLKQLRPKKPGSRLSDMGSYKNLPINSGNDLKDVIDIETRSNNKHRRILQSATRVQRIDRRPKYAQELMISKVGIDPTAIPGTQFRTQFLTDNQRVQQEY